MLGCRSVEIELEGAGAAVYEDVAELRNQS